VTNIHPTRTPTFRALVRHENELVGSLRAAGADIGVRDLIRLVPPLRSLLSLQIVPLIVSKIRSRPVERSCTIATRACTSLNLRTKSVRHTANRSDR
jgi:hypothetical protein